MICTYVQSCLSAYADGELTGFEMLKVQEHVRLCPTCAAELEEVRGLKRMMSNMGCPEPPVGFEERLLSRIQTDQTFAKPERLPWGRMVAVTSLAAAVTWFAFVNLTPKKNATSQPESSLAFEVKRDQAFMVGADPMGGSPVITAGFGGR